MVDKCDDDYNNNNNDCNDINFEDNIVNNNDEMNILIKHLENNWTIKKKYTLSRKKCKCKRIHFKEERRTRC